MTLRLALVIDGDPAGAVKAVQDTGKAVDDLNRKTDGMTKTVEGQKNAWGSMARSAEDAAEAAGKSATEMDKLGGNAGTAAPEIQKAGEAAGGAATGFGALGLNLGKVAGSFAAGLGAGIVINALDQLIGKAASYATSFLDNSADVEAALKGHAALVRDIKDAYGEASGAASSYGNNSKTLLQFQAQQDEKRLAGELKGEAKDAFDDIGAPARRPDSPFASTITQLRKDLKDGKADVIAFRNEIAKIGEALPEDSPFRKMGEDLIAGMDKAAELQEELRRTQDLAKALQGDADAAATALGGAASKYGELGGAAGTAAPPVGQVAGSLAEAGPAGDAAGAGAGNAATGFANAGNAAASAAGQISAYNRALAGSGSGAPTVAPTSVPVIPRPLAGGGDVFGAGTATSDSIPAMLSNGEFVVRAQAANRFRPLLHAINSGSIGGYADGGTIGEATGGRLFLKSAGSPAGGSQDSPASGAAGDFARLADQMDRFGDRLEASGDDTESFGDRIKEGLPAMFESLLQSLMSNIQSAITQMLQSALTGAGGGGGGGLGGILGSLLGGGISPLASAAIAGGGVGLYSGGGHTGAIGRDTIAGFVHGDEFVFDADSTAAIGVPALEAMQRTARGFSNGGFTGSGSGPSGQGLFGAPSIQFINMGTAQQVRETREEEDGQGGRRITYVLDDMQAGALARQGSKSRQTMQGVYGLRARTVPR